MAQSPDEITVPIAEAASDVLDRPVTDLPPLGDAIDLTALDSVISANPAHNVSVTFQYAGLRVIAHSDNTVYVYPLQGIRPD